MEQLSDAQRSLLNIHGAAALRDFVKAGALPDTPEVNARIAERCLWNNPASWVRGPWFHADWVGGGRSGAVRVQRCTLPDGRARYYVAVRGGCWCDSLTEEEARGHLRARRVQGRLVLCTEEEAREAARDYNLALSH